MLKTIWHRATCVGVSLLSCFVLFAPPASIAEEGEEDAEAQLSAPAPAPALESEPEPESAYDPFDGMDRDGRIPTIDKSQFVSRPERWRYIPEGRIKPGNLFDRFLVSSFIVPIVFQNSDVGTGLGLGITDVDFRKQRRREFLGAFLSYTTEGQQSYVVRWRRWLKHLDVPSGGVLQEERSFLRAGAGYRKSLTLRFFGTGSTTNERNETSYTDEVGFVDLGFAQSLGGEWDDFVVEGGIRAEGHWLSEGRVAGEPNTELIFADQFEDADGDFLGWLTAGFRWDTRDSQRNPYSGSAIGARIDAALGQTDGDVGVIYSGFADKVFTVWPLFHDGGGDDEENPPTDTFAIHAEAHLTSGDLPFFALPTLGGSRIQRGFIAGRWRDDAAWTAAAEYRFWVIPRGFTVWRHIRVERIGAALFYEVGGVAGNGYSLFEESVIQSYGVSGRVTVERAAIFRADFGFSDEGFNFSAGFGLSF